MKEFSSRDFFEWSITTIKQTTKKGSLINVAGLKKP